jgi:hypothetical protein
VEGVAKRGFGSIELIQTFAEYSSNRKKKKKKKKKEKRKKLQNMFYQNTNPKVTLQIE